MELFIVPENNQKTIKGGTMRKEIYEVLERIDAEICQSGIYEVLDEAEADDLWLKLMFQKAKKAGISEEEVKKYICNE
jgi:hypothetical protein